MIGNGVEGSDKKGNWQNVKKANGPGSFRKSDVFLEPFEEGICIRDNLTKTHRLLFNKYPSRKYHVLIITKEKELQGDLLNERDFEAQILTMRALDGVVYYNAGQASGASQDHKHLQCIPITSLPYKKIPINERVMEAMKRGANENLNKAQGQSQNLREGI